MNEDERGDAFWGIPKLRLLVVLEYYLGVPWALIRLQRIYNFLLFHAIILLLLDVYGLYFTYLYHFWD